MQLKREKITKKKLYRLKEDNLMFITNPGRMGDEDGCTFIIQKGKIVKRFVCYRVSGWMNNKTPEITLDDMEKVFPKWIEAWNNSTNKEYDGKYKYIYMGFGNGLCVDKSLYDIFKLELEHQIRLKKELHEYSDEYSTIYNSWEEVVEKMARRHNIIVRCE
jgi:hypothetical protein